MKGGKPLVVCKVVCVQRIELLAVVCRGLRDGPNVNAVGIGDLSTVELSVDKGEAVGVESVKNGSQGGRRMCWLGR